MNPFEVRTNGQFCRDFASLRDCGSTHDYQNQPERVSIVQTDNLWYVNPYKYIASKFCLMMNMKIARSVLACAYTEIPITASFYSLLLILRHWLRFQVRRATLIRPLITANIHMFSPYAIWSMVLVRIRCNPQKLWQQQPHCHHLSQQKFTINEC